MGCLAVVLGSSGCSYRPDERATRTSGDCAFYQRAAERMRQPDGLASNVDPEVAWNWLAREAAASGCATAIPAKR